METETINGTLDAIRFHGNGFLIGKLASGKSIKGNMHNPQLGMAYTFKGQVEKSIQWGDTFVFQEFEASYPQETSAIRTYLMENCKWIGPKIATTIVKHFGSDTLKTCKERPNFVAEQIVGLTLERALEVSLFLRGNEQKEKMEIELNKLFGGLKIPKRVTAQIADKWGLESVKEIKENPYQLIDLFQWVGFITADQIALKAGYDFKGTPRIHHAIIHVMKESVFKGGHTILPGRQVVIDCKKLTGLTREDILPVVRLMLDDKKTLVQVNTDYLSLKYIYDNEVFISKKITELLEEKAENGKPDFKGLQEDQKEALEKAVSSKVFILTGAPGTGKTFTIKKIIDSFDGSTIKLAAPTGKAAKRIYEQSGMKAETIHRLLEPTPTPDGFLFARDSENPIDADIIILDETSMVDVPLFARFLDAVDKETRLILVGDTYQLPSVGPGNVLKDLINSGKVPTTELTIIKRQDEGLIIRNCHRVKNGENIILMNSEKPDFFLLERSSEEEIKNSIVELVSKRLAPAYEVRQLNDIQVISPLREKTTLSCKELNKALQLAMNKNKPVDKSIFRIGDKVIQVKNDYRLEIINGDIGYIKNIGRESKTIKVDFENPLRTVNVPLWGNDLELAYAVTCHKYQGSESKIIVIPIHPIFGPFIMQRNWIYTAISRASKVCILVGDSKEVEKIIKRNNQQKRFTLLKDHLANGN